MVYQIISHGDDEDERFFACAAAKDVSAFKRNAKQFPDGGNAHAALTEVAEGDANLGICELLDLAEEKGLNKHGIFTMEDRSLTLHYYYDEPLSNLLVSNTGEEGTE